MSIMYDYMDADVLGSALLGAYPIIFHHHHPHHHQEEEEEE